MKVNILVFVLMVFLLNTNLTLRIYTEAQTKEEVKYSKKELKKIYKQWKKKKKRQKPLEYKQMIEDYEQKIIDLNDYTKGLKSKSDKLQGKEIELTTENEDLKKQVSELTDALIQCQSQKIDTSMRLNMPATIASNPVVTPKPVSKNTTSGIVFKIQIGAFKSFDIRDYLWNNEGMSGVTDGDLLKYTIGQFRDYDSAKKFETDLKRMGLKDAFIVAFSDGKKIPIGEAIRKLKN